MRDTSPSAPRPVHTARQGLRQASPGPHDATYLFDCFRDMMETGAAPTGEQMHAAQEKLAKAGRK